ncbi:MAG: hypothetical protein H8D63_02025 [Parcubacteria group bacterium]|nr:hypothetical protein [Parcubacteria group bacterium]
MKHNKKDLWEIKKSTLLLIHAGIVAVLVLSLAWYMTVESEFSQIVFGASLIVFVFFFVRNIVGYVWRLEYIRNIMRYVWILEHGLAQSGKERVSLMGARETLLFKCFNKLCASGADVPILGYWLGQKKYSTLLRTLHEAYYKRRIVQPL